MRNTNADYHLLKLLVLLRIIDDFTLTSNNTWYAYKATWYYK